MSGFEQVEQRFLESCRRNPILGKKCWDERIKPLLIEWLTQVLKNKKAESKKPTVLRKYLYAQAHAIEDLIAEVKGERKKCS